MVLREPAAVLRFALLQRDWRLAELITDRIVPPANPLIALAERATTTLADALGLQDAGDYDLRR